MQSSQPRRPGVSSAAILQSPEFFSLQQMSSAMQHAKISAANQRIIPFVNDFAT
jgi:hypothetical protein